MSVVDDIKSRIALADLVSETVKLRKSGRAYTGLCPFHAHRNNTPSFAVWPDTGTWRCFGQCNEGGDAFSFVMKRDGVDFAEALRVLAARTGVELKPRTPAEQVRDDSLDQLREVLDAAVVYYHHLLKNAPQAEHARAHLAGRGLTTQAVELFQLGYALDAWDAGLQYFTDKGWSRQMLLDAGLIVEKDEHKIFDRFRDRLMIPVRDERGRMTGFQARALKPDAVPKFMNSPQTALFDKGRTLFGLDLARKPIREAEAAVVVEGNLDVIAAHQAGFTNVVSSQGTALTEHQLRLLKKYARRIILALDADEAGDAATLRGLTVAREALDRETEILFDPRGLVRTEGRLGADIRVMTLPAGLDPDEVIRQSGDDWRRLVEAAEPVVAYVIRVVSQGRDLNDPKVKTDIAGTVLPLIEDVAEPIERDTYRQQLARLLHVDQRALTIRRPSASRPARRAPARQAAAGAEARPARPAPRETSQLESYCLGALLRRPELLYKADRELQALNLPRLSAEDFLNSEHQLIFRQLLAALDQFEAEPVEYVRQHLDGALGPQLEALQSGVAAQETDDGKAAESLILNALRLRRRNEKLLISELRFLAEEARAQGDDRAYTEALPAHAAALARLDQALAPKSKRGNGPSQRIGVR